MKINVILNHKQCQPEIEGVRSLPENYTITVNRSDGCGISRPEVMTVLQTCLGGLEGPYNVLPMKHTQENNHDSL